MPAYIKDLEKGAKTLLEGGKKDLQAVNPWPPLKQALTTNPFSNGPVSSDPKAPTFHADDMITSVYGGLNQTQIGAIRNALAEQGITEQSTPAAFRNALNQLPSTNPSFAGLSSYNKTSNLFGGGTQNYDVGALAAELTKLDAPYISQENQSADAYQSAVAPYISKLPASMQPMENLMTQSQVSGMKDMAIKQMLAGQAQPIANALATQAALNKSINNTQLRDALLGISGAGTSSILPTLPAATTKAPGT